MTLSDSEPALLHRTPGAAAYLKRRFGIERAPAYLAKLRVIGGGPTFVRVGTRDVAYEQAALDAWAATLISKPYRSTSDAA